MKHTQCPAEKQGFIGGLLSSENKLFWDTCLVKCCLAAQLCWISLGLFWYFNMMVRSDPHALHSCPLPLSACRIRYEL